MKKILSLTLAATLISFSSMAFAADTTISIKKAGASTATVAEFPSGKNSAVVPIKFKDGASWSSLKDSYTVSSETASAVASKQDAITVSSDGGISFVKCKAACPKPAKKTAAAKEATKPTQKADDAKK